MLLVVIHQRHPPQRFTGGRARHLEEAGQRVVVDEHPTGSLSERDLHRTRKGGDVDEGMRLHLGHGVGHRVRQHEAALRVGIGHLTGPAPVVGQHITGTQCVRPYGILGAGHQPGHLHRALQR